MSASPAGNPVPTAGELRLAWSKGRRALAPVVPYVRDGVYLTAGVVLAVTTLRAVRREQARRRTSGAALSREGEQALHTVRDQQLVHEAGVVASNLADTVGTTAQRTADNTHDAIEELYFHLSQLPRTLARLPTKLWERIATGSGRADASRPPEYS